MLNHQRVYPINDVHPNQSNGIVDHYNLKMCWYSNGLDTNSAHLHGYINSTQYVAPEA